MKKPCIGKMNHYFTVLERKLVPVSISKKQADEVFISKGNFWGNFNVVKPTERFNGVTVSSNVTHKLIMRYDDEIYQLDKNTLFIEMDSWSDKIKRFKLDSIQRVDEFESDMILYLIDQGFTTKEATKG